MKKGSTGNSYKRYLLEETPVKRLRFLVEFMRKLDLGMDDIAKAAKTGKAAVRHWFIVDSINIKKLMEVAEYFGYDLVFSYEVPPLEIDGVSLYIDEPRGSRQEPDITKRLYFIRAAMAECGISASTLAKKLGVARETIQRVFKTDNISIDYVYRIAELYGWKLTIAFKKLDNQGEKDGEGQEA